MSTFPTNKTVPLDKDIAVTDAKTQSISTAAREQLSVVLDALDSAIATETTNRQAAVSAEATTRANADTTLQNNINSEAATRAAADTSEASTRAAADTAEASARSTQDTNLQTEIDGERSPLRVTVTGSDTKISIAAATQTRYNSSASSIGSLGVPSGAFQSTFPGAQVDFNAGTITYTGGSPSAGSFTVLSPTGNANKYTAYSVVLLPTAPDTLLVTGSGSWASSISAVSAPVVSGGVPIAIVYVQANSGGTGIQNTVQTNVVQFVAAGSGSGSGAGSPLDPQPDETFTYYTRSDFSVDKKQFFGSTTGTESILGLKKIVLGVGQQFVSTDLTGPQFRNDQTLINAVQARLMYNSGLVDETPTVEASIDGGNSWTTGTVTLPGSSSTSAYKSNIIEADWSFTASSSPIIDGGTANGTLTSGQKVAAIISPSYRTIVTGFSMNLRSSATAGTVTGYIYTVSSGIPQTLMATSAETYLANQDFTSTAAYLRFSFKNISLEAGTQYALAIEGSGLNANISIDQVTTAPTQSVSSASGTSSYAASGNKLAFRTYGMGGDLRLRVTSSTANSELAGFGVEYVSDSPQAVRGDASYELRTLTSTEASTGLITLNGVRYTPGAHQLLVISNNHIMTGPNDFTEVSSSSVQFAANFFQPGDIVIFYNAYGLVDGSSQSLGKLNTMYDAVVGTSAQLAAGYATHTSLQTAINNVAAGSKILLMTSVTENITLNKNLVLEGKGYGTSVTGTFTISANFSTVRDLRFAGNVTISGNGNIVRESFIASGSTVTDSGTANSKLIVSE